MSASQTKRMREKWREKVWIWVKAPPAFGEKTLAYIPVSSLQGAVGRVIEVTLFDITQEDPQHYQLKLYFQITKVEDHLGYTVFKGYEYAREYLRSLVKRGSSLVDFIRDYITKDGYRVRIYFTAFTEKRINSSRKRRIRQVAHKVLSERVPAMGYDQLAQEIVLGKLASDILKEAKKIAPLRHVGIRKCKLVGLPPPAEEQRVVSAEVPVEKAPSA